MICHDPLKAGNLVFCPLPAKFVGDRAAVLLADVADFQLERWPLADPPVKRWQRYVAFVGNDLHRLAGLDASDDDALAFNGLLAGADPHLCQPNTSARALPFSVA